MGRYWLVLGGNGLVLIGTSWYWVSRWRYLSVEGGSMSVEGGTGWYLVVLGQ